jgi:hypothetical protein
MVPKECFCHIVVDIGYWAPDGSWRMKVCLLRECQLGELEDSKHLVMKCSKVIKVCKAFKECNSITTKLPHLGEDHT